MNTPSDTARAHVLHNTSKLDIDGDVICITQTLSDPMNQIRDQVTTWRIHTADQQVRAGLIALGWTPPKAEPQRTPRPDCIACGGLGKIHVQVPGEFRTASVPCQCWRLA